MTLTTCPDCNSTRVVVSAGTRHARIRTHHATDPTTHTMRPCPGSGRPVHALTTREA